MSFIVYGTDNSKRVYECDSIENAYNALISEVNSYMLNNYNYKIERYYHGS